MNTNYKSDPTVTLINITDPHPDRRPLRARVHQAGYRTSELCVKHAKELGMTESGNYTLLAIYSDGSMRYYKFRVTVTEPVVEEIS